MSIWFLLWLLLSCTLLYFMGWTFFILYRQKKIWKAFAVKHKLRYQTVRMFASPDVSGAMGDYTVHLFTGEHVSDDVRRSRKLIGVEIKLLGALPVTCGVASGGMVQTLREFGAREEIRPVHPAWQEAWMAGAEEQGVLDSYLTKERLDALISLMKVRNSWVILVFKGGSGLLRFDTADPLDSSRKIETIVKRMLDTAKVLELAPGEAERLKALRDKKENAAAGS